MNILDLAHRNIRAKFRLRVYSLFIYYGGFALLTWADWRIALGVFMVLTAIHTTEGTR